MNKSIGVLGGGQLGRMLYLAGSQYDINLKFMDQVEDGPVSVLTNRYTLGDITSETDILHFAQDTEVVTIEIERVNVEALALLEKKGIKVYPQSSVIAKIQDKGIQKQFYLDHKLPSAPFKSYDNISSFVYDLDANRMKYPVVQKMRRDGYDGRGVQILRSDKDLDKAFPYNFICEELVDIDKELAIITCTDLRGNIVLYDPVEMVFHPEHNILLYQLAPAELHESTLQSVKDIALRTAKAFGNVGLLAIELFLTKEGEVLINEVAPRPHNSGHHTIEASATSQYDNHLRAISGMPLSGTETLTPSLLMNILGEEGHNGAVIYKGIDEITAIPGVHVHIYQKAVTKPYRKMGHITIIGASREELIQKYEHINKALSVESHKS